MTFVGISSEFLYLTVGDGLFGQIVVDDECVFAVVAEELAHGAARIGRQELQWGGIGSRSRHDDGVAYRARVRQTLHDLSDSRTLLSDGDVDAVQLLLLVAGLVETLLVDDRIDGDSGLSKHEPLFGSSDLLKS
ncbi:hypothetical protein WR25_08915 [Diploscapter pachys]|uniref:Uncharacterized protein n=1 Tax=Diploscapter pachys TaxID=2018661 RepID=A0A2A2KMY7_9BILA|nr:hypothetical protein WR25_08915 [Diploscapter pachys]